MKLNKLTIENFHCYQHVEFELGEKTTVFIGKNGTGKSSVLKALKHGISLFFAPNKWTNEGSFVGPMNDTRPLKFQQMDIWHDNDFVYADSASIHCTASIDNTDNIQLSWGQKQIVGDETLDVSYELEKAYLSLLHYCKRKHTYPLFAYYSDRFPHIEDYIDNTKTNSISQIQSRLNSETHLDPRFGYWRWDSEPAATIFWRCRYENVLKSMAPMLYKIYQLEKSGKAVDEAMKKVSEEQTKYLDFVRERLKTFTTRNAVELTPDRDDWSLNDLGLDPGGKLGLDFDNESKLRWDELPAGYERLLNIVFDIAYRSLLLNGPDKEVRGVVIIDEIDLHLHPSLQRNVLQRFRLAFPEVQFIVTTHSPIVISHFPELKGNKVIQLEHENDIYNHYEIPHWYGMDYLTTLQMVMQTDPNTNYLRELMNRYVRFMRRGKQEMAKDVLSTIEQIVDNNEERMNLIVNELNGRLKEEV